MTTRLRACLITFLLACSVPGVVGAKDLLITSNPPGAQIFVDGRPFGKTPLRTTRKELMPNRAWDGLMTQVTISVELALYEPQARVVSEFGFPAILKFELQKKAGSEHFENYLEEVDGLAEKTIASDQYNLRTTEDMDRDSEDLYSQGYVLIGYLGYAAEIVPIDAIREKSGSLGAAVVLVQSRSAGVQTEMREVTSKSSGGLGAAMSSGSASAGSRGTFQVQGNQPAAGGVSGGWSNSASGSFTQSGLSFVPGRSVTEFVPFARRQFDTQATLWRKRKRTFLGAYTEVLPHEIRGVLRRNTGAFVVAIEDESPAFFANLLIGDVVVGIGGRQVTRPEDLDELARLMAARTVELEVLRPEGQVKLVVDLIRR